MSLWARVYEERRRVIVPLGLLAAVSLATWILAVLPLQSSVAPVSEAHPGSLVPRSDGSHARRVGSHVWHGLHSGAASQHVASRPSPGMHTPSPQSCSVGQQPPSGAHRATPSRHSAQLSGGSHAASSPQASPSPTRRWP